MLQIIFLFLDGSRVLLVCETLSFVYVFEK
jgi:hypothetical protein